MRVPEITGVALTPVLRTAVFGVWGKDLAADLDRNYVEAFKTARKAGVEAFALCCKVTTTEITAVRAIPVLDP